MANKRHALIIARLGAESGKVRRRVNVQSGLRFEPLRHALKLDFARRLQKVLSITGMRS